MRRYFGSMGSVSRVTVESRRQALVRLPREHRVRPAHRGFVPASRAILERASGTPRGALGIALDARRVRDPQVVWPAE